LRVCGRITSYHHHHIENSRVRLGSKVTPKSRQNIRKTELRTLNSPYASSSSPSGPVTSCPLASLMALSSQRFFPTARMTPSLIAHSLSSTSSLTCLSPFSKCLPTCSMRSSQQCGPLNDRSQNSHMLRCGGSRRLIQQRVLTSSRLSSNLSRSSLVGLPGDDDQGACMRRWCCVKRSLRLKSFGERGVKGT